MMHQFAYSVFALAVIAAVAGIALSQPGAPPGEACGFGPPPGSPPSAQHEAREAAEYAAKGYLTVCAANLERFDVTPRLKPLERASDGLAFKPVDLAGTPFARFSVLGAMQDSNSGKKS